MMLSLLISTTCMACSDNSIQVNLEKANLQEEGIVSDNQKKSIYIELNSTKDKKEVLPSTEQGKPEKTSEESTGKEHTEKKYRELLDEIFSKAITQNSANPTTEEVLDEEVASTLPESDETLEPKQHANPLVLSINGESILEAIDGSTSFKKDADGFGFTQSIATMYKQYDGFSIDVAGHTDSKGSSSYNLMLSQRRADTVKQWFEAKSIDATSISATGYGEAQPLAMNANGHIDHIDGRVLNRRINIATILRLKLNCQ